MKGLILIMDGMGDRPIKELGNKTPLEAANTPNMDKMAEEGNIGINQYGINLIVENVGTDNDFPNVEIELSVENDGSVSVNRAFVGKNHESENSIG